MIAKKSPFILQNFLLLKSELTFIPPTIETKVNILEIFEKYLIDIDFNLKDIQDGQYQLYVKIEINRSKDKEPGYSILIEGVGIFVFGNTAVTTTDERGNYLYFSGISICINSLRTIISGITSHGPFGKYSLPTIEVNDLLESKGILKHPKAKG